MIKPYTQRDKPHYTKNLAGMGLIGVGAFLIIEHIYAWGEFSFYDFIGHEWLGLVLIIAGIVLNTNLDKDRYSPELIELKNKIKKLLKE